jgi:hypothetical protein
VESGSRLVQSAGSAMQEISADVEKVTRMIGDITHATQEQSSGIGLINQSVASLDGATQQNAALVEQASAAAESLKIQAQRLSGAVAIFRLAQHPDPHGYLPKARTAMELAFFTQAWQHWPHGGVFAVLESFRQRLLRAMGSPATCPAGASMCCRPC